MSKQLAHYHAVLLLRMEKMLDPTPAALHAGETSLRRTIGLTKRYGNFLPRGGF
jgi:hypothetical protein